MKERITVNLAADVSEALAQHVHGSGENKTETVGRAILMYTWLRGRLRAGDTLIIRTGDTEREIKIF